MMRLSVLFLIGLTIVTANAQTINLRGKISDKNTKPVSDAVVTVVRQNLRDTTGTDGIFSISKNIVAVLPEIKPAMEKISLSQGVLQLSLANSSPVKIDMYDVRGTLLKREKYQRITAGEYRFNIAEYSFAEKLLIIKVSINQQTTTFRYVPLQNGKFGVNTTIRALTPVSSTLAKLASDVDSVKVTASGYVTKVVPIASYDQELNITLDAEGSTVPSGGCGKVATLKNGTYTVKIQGTDRQYIIDIPTNYDKNHPYRLIFGFHWLGGTMQDVATGQTVSPKNTWMFYGLKRLDTLHTCIFIAPQGLKESNGTGWPNTNGRDVEFVDSMLSIVENDLCIDKSRIFSVGFSYGGMMGNTLSCERPDVFRAIMSHSGAGGCSKTQKPVAFFGAGGTEGTNNSVLATARRIAKANGCADPNQSAPFPAAGSLQHTSTVFTGCNAKYPVKFCAFDQGHKAAPYDNGCAQCDDALKSWLPQADWDFLTQF